jgi:hypothetical protein
MSPDMGRAAFRIGMIIALPALWLLLFVVRPGTAAFAATVVTAVIGLVFLALVAVIIKVFSS